MVEGARLEIVWAEMSRRFESSRFRQEVMKNRTLCAVFLLLFSMEKLEMRTGGSLRGSGGSQKESLLSF